MTNADWDRLDNCIRDNFTAKQYHTAKVIDNVHVDAKLKCMNTCIQQAIDECVPDKKMAKCSESGDLRLNRNAHVSSVL